MQFAGDSRDGNDWYENMHIIAANWNAIVKKRDLVMVLGDVCMDRDCMDIFYELNGTKHLIRGNHDDRFRTEGYLRYFSEIYGIRSYKGFWISHAPIHPAELRGRKNIHGHVHQQSIRNAHGELDERYINVCVENTGGVPVKFKYIQEGTWRGVL
jgi:calcineurin-like phosphoesterase family protein